MAKEKVKTSTKPTHTLCMKPSESPHAKWVTVGAGWENESESGTYISIRLNRGITLTWRDMEDMSLALFEAYK